MKLLKFAHLCCQERRVLRQQVAERRRSRLLPGGDAQRDSPLHQVLFAGNSKSDMASQRNGQRSTRASVMWTAAEVLYEPKQEQPQAYKLTRLATRSSADLHLDPDPGPGNGTSPDPSPCPWP